MYYFLTKIKLFSIRLRIIKDLKTFIINLGIHSLDFDVEPYLSNPTSEVSFVDLDSDFIYE